MAEPGKIMSELCSIHTSGRSMEHDPLGLDAETMRRLG
jgi:hypothetical protein